MAMPDSQWCHSMLSLTKYELDINVFDKRKQIIFKCGFFKKSDLRISNAGKLIEIKN